MLWRYVLLTVGVFSTSMSVILIRMSPTQPVVLSALRLLLAGLLLGPVFLHEWRRHGPAFTAAHWRCTLAPSVLLALHFSSWSYGARLTGTAQASLIVNLVPVAMPFLLHWLVQERINRVEIVGTVIALGGVALLMLPDALAGGGDLRGNSICFVSMLLVAGYVAYSRKNRDFPSLWLYVVPIYLQSGLLCLLAALPQVRAFGRHGAQEWWLVVALAVGPTILGHTIINHALRHIRGQVVGLFTAAQFIFPTVVAYLFFHEHPVARFYVASLVVISGIALVIFSAPSAPPPAVE
ncbi:MAG: DMT family transporter [Verrucomicrobia bacterium]|nr:DMT family transporter [Verrucomicrobiota bacterium]